ncbi:MAG: DUF1801 domain-containing protein [Bacteroidota bacterium]
MAETQFGSFDDLLALTSEELIPIVITLKQLIEKIDPNTCEVVRLGDRAATYGVGPKKMKEGYVYVLPHKSWVNLGFYQGALLDDPDGLLEGTGKKLRHIKIKSVEQAQLPAIQSLIGVALEERRATTGN